MKNLVGLFAICVLFFAPWSLAQELSLPNCAIICVGTALQNSTCSPLDSECICTNSALTSQVETCLRSSCTIKELLLTRNTSSIYCGEPVRNKTKVYTGVVVSLYVLSTSAVALRLVARFLSRDIGSYDDGMVLLVLLLNTAIFYFGLQLGRYGVGQDIWTLPYKSIDGFLFAYWIAGLLYLATISLCKISFCLFFLRIFPGRHIRLMLWSLIALNIVVGIAFVMIGCFACHPISFGWNGWDGEHKGQCNFVRPIAFSSAGISIALDIVTLILPITQIWGLQLGLKKRIGVSLMLSIGAFMTVVSILRLQSLIVFGRYVNPTWDSFGAALWSLVELDVGIICLCMPALRLLIIRIFPKVSTQKTETPHNGISTARLARESRISHGISYERDYYVEFASRSSTQMQNEGSFVQLVEVEASKEGKGP